MYVSRSSCISWDKDKFAKVCVRKIVRVVKCSKVHIDV